MKDNDPPPAPDPRVVAAAQTASNKETAIANAYLNRVDQTNPYGSSTYEVTGKNPDGTPKFSQSTQFSAPVQGLFDTNMKLSQGMGDIGNSQLAGLSQQLSQPFSLDTATEDKINDLGRKRLDPLMAQQEEGLTNRLAQRGIMPGTEAYDREMTRFGQTRNDAYNSLFINGRQQGAQEALLQRQQPLNEFNALRSATQVNSPTFAGVPGVTQANTDVAGITQAGFQNQMGLYNAQNAQNNAMMSGIFGIGAAAAGAMPWSDRRLKTDIVRVGSYPSGLAQYEWTYIFGGPRHRGVMADEARAMFPDAVQESAGFLSVDYARIS